MLPATEKMAAPPGGNTIDPMAGVPTCNAPESTCPNCRRDLAAKPLGRKAPYTSCPFCGVQLLPIWWQRIIWTTVGTVFSFALPAFLGFKGWTVFFVGLLCWFPAFVFAGILVF